LVSIANKPRNPKLSPLATSDIIGHLTIGYTVSSMWSIWNNHLLCTVVKIWCFWDFAVMTLTFWGHVTSSVVLWNPWSLYLASLLRCVKHLAEHIPIENALIPIYVSGAKLGATSFYNFVLVAAP